MPKQIALRLQVESEYFVQYTASDEEVSDYKEWSENTEHKVDGPSFVDFLEAGRDFSAQTILELPTVSEIKINEVRVVEAFDLVD